MKNIINELKAMGLGVKGFEEVETCEDQLILTIEKDGSDVFFRYAPLDYRLYFFSKNEEFEGDYIRCADENHFLKLMNDNLFMFNENVEDSKYFTKTKNYYDESFDIYA